MRLEQDDGPMDRRPPPARCVQESLRRQVDAIARLPPRGDVFLRLRQRLPAGSLARRGCRDGRGGRSVIPPMQDIMGRCSSTTASARSAGSAPRAAPKTSKFHRPPRRRSIGGDPRHGARRDRRRASTTTSTGSARPAVTGWAGRRFARVSSMPTARGAHGSHRPSARPLPTGVSAPSCWAATTDVSGTDSPYRETSNIYDGSNLTADMAVQNVIGDSVPRRHVGSIHNGGVGWGEVINGGFGMVVDGSEDADRHPGDAAVGCQQRHRPPANGRATRVPCRPYAARWNAPRPAGHAAQCRR